MTRAIKRSDVIVVGGGVLGLAASYELASQGRTVTSVYPQAGDREAASLAAGAMLGALGEITGDDGDSERDELEFRIAAQRRYPDWLGAVCERSKTKVHQGHGSFIIANNEGVADRGGIRRMKLEADRYKIPAEWVEPDQVPGLNPGHHYAPGLCLALPEEHSVDSGQLLSAIAAAAASYEGWTRVDGRVVAARQDSAGWVVTTSNGETYAADHLVLAGGSRVFDCLEPDVRAAAKLPAMLFGKGVSCLVRGAPAIPQTIRTPNRAFACGIHVVPRSDGLLYLGATNCLGVDHDAEQGVQVGELHNLFDEIVHQINTDIRLSRIVDVRYGYRPIPATRSPVVGRTDLQGLSVATGTYRNGILMAPLVARIIADGIADKQVENPFAVGGKPVGAPIERLSEIGVRDILGFLHEPRGSLPYNRAAELRKYTQTLFEMAVFDDSRHAALRLEIQQRLKDAPFNETMHKLFYEIVERADTLQRKTPAA